MELIPVEKAIGMILAHDMTEIIPGKSKCAAFKRGHVVKKEDIPRLLRMGKEHIGIIVVKEGDIHENDAAIRMATAAAGLGIELTEPSEGKVNFIAKNRGLLKINYKALFKINSIEDIMMATRHTDILIESGEAVGGTRIIPLITDSQKIVEMEAICKENDPIVQVLPFRKFKVGIVTTGSEVYHKRIEDKFGPVIKNKFDELGCEVIGQIFANDDADMIAESVHRLIDQGAEFITCTGGMSVDPDDVTPLGIRKTGACVVSYGAPTLPGAMFMLAYKNNIPIVGLPGCVMYSKRTIFDLTVPRLVVGEKLTKEDIIRLGHGGFCSSCKVCTFPNCGFGKGGLY
ncbi:molybdopterin-binding protein [Marinisporobacter balticus]|uniref:Molybdopterin molybdenumtransferase n=1 Tax=Marinisporobacter balticus TaxID=2018667 RepID=A0A4R2KP23_9FIRM|nr:molybdopterin-binding protein [Marinisporobacter balticus]TCO71818.1 molybdenum cofactor synthesis domain-containing protein [Marinisporobacter balticus]